jgi:hypothetical protein
LLQEKVLKLEKSQMLDTFGINDRSKSISTEIKRLNQELRDRDKTNIELHR